MLNESDRAHPVTINLSGMVHFFIGMAVILVHPLWGSLLEVIVSLMGIGFMLKGALLIAIPKVIMKSNNATVARLPKVGAGFLAMSAYLAYAAFFAA
ncbi:hypothetical protein FKG94_01385 [Exilibacterium tricleocarpae]|uniref:Uncharacterized protein n=2 Tax=Exilibacterium tricleocarpae TaxID=2591008 RepID=A0A545U9T4_9GAMM|nr:hypothetical protein FKG94_01385 [Exilibacterium tricleocarpae]